MDGVGHGRGVAVVAVDLLVLVDALLLDEDGAPHAQRRPHLPGRRDDGDAVARRDARLERLGGLQRELHLDDVDPAPELVAELTPQRRALESERLEERDAGRVLRGDARDEHVQVALVRTRDQRLDELPADAPAMVARVDVDGDFAREAEAELLHRREVGEADNRVLALRDDHHLVAVRLQPRTTPRVGPRPLVERGDAFEDLAVVDALDRGHIVCAGGSDRDGLPHALLAFADLWRVAAILPARSAASRILP